MLLGGLLIFVNQWIWRIFQSSIPFFFLLAVSTIALISRKHSYFYLSFSLLLVGATIFLFDKSMFTLSINDAEQLESREEFYAQEYGKLYRNKYAITFHKEILPDVFVLKRNIFDTLDLNYYFFASHPRERSYATEFTNFSFLLLPFFFFGLHLTLKKIEKNLVVVFCIAVFLSAMLPVNNPFGHLFLFPFIVWVIYDGTWEIIRYVFKKNI